MIQPSTRTGWARTLPLVCAIALLWLATRPYFGVVFDARFYMLEALNALDHARFADDLYVKFGSQGSFSLFTKLYLPFLRAFGVGATGMILTVAGQLLWLFGLYHLARTLVGGRMMWLSMAVVIGMLQIYAGGFGYGEAYVTARLYAEAIVMLGLALLTTRPRAAIALLVLAAALHPLMALPGLAIALVYLALGRPVWWVVMAAGLGLAAVLGAAGVVPFSNLLRTLDPEWFAIANIRSPHTLVRNWPSDAFADMATTVALGVAALVLAGPAHRRFLAAALVVGVGGVVLTFLGGDVAHNLLVVQIQPWRSMWLLQIIARICVPLVFAGVLARTSFDSFRWATLLSLGMVLCACVTRLARHPDSADFTPLSLMLVVAALVLMAVHLLIENQKRIVALVSTLAGLALVPLALSRWDQRSPWIRYVESPEPTPGDLAALLPDKASVYWESGLEMLWLRMRHASYFSCDQGTGVLFYRQTAMAYKHRSASFWPLRTGDFTALDTCIAFDPRPKPERNRAGLQSLCRKEPGLDYVVLAAPLGGVEAKTWQAPVHFQDMQSSSGKFFSRVADRFYIYSCAAVR